MKGHHLLAVTLISALAICSLRCMAAAEEDKADAPRVRLELLARQPNQWNGEPIRQAAYKHDGAVLITDHHVVFLGPNASKGVPSQADVVTTVDAGWKMPARGKLEEAIAATLSDDGELVLLEVWLRAKPQEDDDRNASLYDYRGKLLHRFKLPIWTGSALSKEARIIVKFGPESIWHPALEAWRFPTSVRFHSLDGHEGDFYRPGGQFLRRSRLVGRSLATVIRYNDKPRVALFRDQQLRWLADLGDVREFPTTVEVSPTEKRVVVLTPQDRMEEMLSPDAPRRPGVRIYDADGGIILEDTTARLALTDKVIFVPAVGEGHECAIVLDWQRAICFDATEGKLLWETSLPAPGDARAEALAFLPAGYLVAGVAFRAKQDQPPAEQQAQLFLLDKDGVLLSQLDLPEAGLAHSSASLIGPANRLVQTLPDGKRFWLRGARDAFLIGVAEDGAAAAAPSDQ